MRIRDEQDEELFELADSDEILPDLEQCKGLGLLLLGLLLLLCVNSLGIADGTLGLLAEIVSGFAPVAFFVIAGFLIPHGNEDIGERLAGKIKKTALIFAVMLVVYVALNALFYAQGGESIADHTPILSKRFWLEWLVLNVWPYHIGDVIWLIQALLYAYVIVYLLNKWRLLWLDGVLFLVLLAAAVVTGELAGVLNIHPFQYAFIPQGFLTRSLPYMLLGCWMKRHMRSLSRVDPLVYVFIGLAGIGLCPLEAWALMRINRLYTVQHLLGMALVAFSICALFFLLANPLSDKPPSYFTAHARLYVPIVYALFQPISVALAFWLVWVSPEAFQKAEYWLWLASFGIGLVIAMLIGLAVDKWQEAHKQKQS